MKQMSPSALYMFVLIALLATGSEMSICSWIIGVAVEIRISHEMKAIGIFLSFLYLRWVLLLPRKNAYPEKERYLGRFLPGVPDLNCR